MQRIKKQPFNLLNRRSLCARSDLRTAGPLASVLKSRSVIRFAGPDCVKFLQGLLTNDVRRFDRKKSSETLVTPNLATEVSPPIYAALLTPQGRFLYDFFLYKPASEEAKLDRTGSGPGSAESDKPFEIFADVDSSVLDEILTSLRRYRLRSKVEIDDVGQEFSCWQRFGGKLSDSPKSPAEPDAAGVGWGSGADRTAAASSQGNGGGWRWFNDPRLDCLGFRGVFPANSIPPLVEADKETGEENYVLWRVENGVAEGSIEIPKGEAIPHEYNLVGLNAISFDKGCYVGQELVARTHHLGVIRKRLLPLRFLDRNGEEVAEKVSPGSEIVASESGKKVGNVRAAIGSRGLGILRLEEGLKKGNLGIKGQEDLKLEASKPLWWPNEWSQHTSLA